MDIRPNMSFALTLKGVEMLQNLETSGKEEDNVATKSLRELFYHDQSPSQVSRKIDEPLSRSQIAFRVLHERGYIEPSYYSGSVAPSTMEFSEMDEEGLRARLEATANTTGTAARFPFSEYRKGLRGEN